MLANPNVSDATFVQIRRWSWKALILASGAEFSSAMVRENFVGAYKKFFAKHVEVEKPLKEYRFTQDALHMVG